MSFQAEQLPNKIIEETSAIGNFKTATDGLIEEHMNPKIKDMTDFYAKFKTDNPEFGAIGDEIKKTSDSMSTSLETFFDKFVFFITNLSTEFYPLFINILSSPMTYLILLLIFLTLNYFYYFQMNDSKSANDPKIRMGITIFNSLIFLYLLTIFFLIPDELKFEPVFFKFQIKALYQVIIAGLIVFSQGISFGQ